MCVELCIGLSVHIKMLLYLKLVLFQLTCVFARIIPVEMIFIHCVKMNGNLQVWHFYEYFIFL